MSLHFSSKSLFLVENNTNERAKIHKTLVLISSLDFSLLQYLGLDATKPVFRVSDKTRLTSVSSSTESS